MPRRPTRVFVGSSRFVGSESSKGVFYWLEQGRKGFGWYRGGTTKSGLIVNQKSFVPLRVSTRRQK